MKPKEKPINVNDAANHYSLHALFAHFQANEAAERGSVSEPHLRRISLRFLSISNFLDSLLEAHERANKK